MQITVALVALSLVIGGAAIVVALIPEPRTYDDVINRSKENLKIVAYTGLGVASIVGAIIVSQYQRVRIKVAEIDREIKKAQLDEIEGRHSQFVHAIDSSDELVDRIADQLTSRARTLAPVSSDAELTSARGPAAVLFHTLLGERFRHFLQEKSELANFLFPLLVDRCRFLAENGQQIRLVIDSGTTLFPFFELFGRWATKERIRHLGAEPAWWGRHLCIVTNSIAGIESLSLSGRLSNDDRYSEVACNSELIGGQPLAVYSATVGVRALSHLRDMRNFEIRDLWEHDEEVHDNGRPTHIIALTTGNYIFAGEKSVRPVARGHGHKDFKEALCEVADEIFVVAPLGKFIVERDDISLADFNQHLQYTPDHSDPKKRSYVAVDIPSKTLRKKTHVVTTSRPHDPKWVFQNHSQHLWGVLRENGTLRQLRWEDLDDLREYMTQRKLSELGHLMLEFSGLPEDAWEQMKIELPHDNVRRTDMARRFFDVTWPRP